MKIIDKETGKRLGKLKNIDPVKKIGDKDEMVKEEEMSPMDPPDAYSKESIVEGVDSEKWNEALRIFKEEHEEATIKIESFEKQLAIFKESGYQLNDEVNHGLRDFFDYFDNDLLPHNRKEEKVLFPLLQKSLLKNNEHGVGENPVTAVDIMEDDHIKFIQLGALAFNMIGLASRLRDEQSRMFTFDVAYNNAKELIELLRLHIFRENNTLFPLAQKYLTEEELNEVLKGLHEIGDNQPVESSSCSH